MLYHASLTAATLTAVSLTLIVPHPQATAATIIGSSRGSFNTPIIDLTTDPNAVFSIENNSDRSETFALGKSAADSMPNQLTFLGTPFVTNTEQMFEVGNLTYFNGRTFLGTHVSSVPLNLSLAFAQPIETQQQFDYHFNFNLTPNTDASSADSLVISDNPTPQTFTVEETNYHVELLGFSQNNGETFTHSFQAAEDERISTALFAQIKLANINQPSSEINQPSPTEIPEPASLASLLMLGSTLLLRKLKFG